MVARPLTVLFMPESAYGPTNNCVGIGAVLRQRGHRVVFAAEASWRGKLEALGFEEDLVDLAPAEAGAGGEGAPAEAGAGGAAAAEVGGGDAGRFWTDFVKETAPAFRLPTIEQLEHFVRPTWQALVDGARYCQPQLEAVLDRQRPDVVVEDNVCAFPALVTSGAPFVRIVSCNPLEMKGPRVPPAFSGYPLEDDSRWAEYRAEYERVLRDLWAEHDDWVRACGAPGLPALEFIHESDVANLYVYPEAVDYRDRRPLGPTWHRLDSSVRATDERFEAPETLSRRTGGLVYLSLGSLGSADVGLMEHLVEVLSRTPHRYIVSKGPLSDRYELADNMWGAPQVPQTSVLPLVDLVITHGGNNTATECFHFGKPMVVLPLFWDQHDNAQRIEETGFGRRLATYDHDPAELVGAVDALLGDRRLRRRMAALGAEIRSRRGTERAATLIEEAASAGSRRPVARPPAG